MPSSVHSTSDPTPQLPQRPSSHHRDVLLSLRNVIERALHDLDRQHPPRAPVHHDEQRHNPSEQHPTAPARAFTATTLDRPSRPPEPPPTPTRPQERLSSSRPSPPQVNRDVIPDPYETSRGPPQHSPHWPAPRRPIQSEVPKPWDTYQGRRNSSRFFMTPGDRTSPPPSPPLASVRTPPQPTAKLQHRWIHAPSENAWPPPPSPHWPRTPLQRRLDDAPPVTARPCPPSPPRRCARVETPRRPTTPVQDVSPCQVQGAMHVEAPGLVSTSVQAELPRRLEHRLGTRTSPPRSTRPEVLRPLTYGRLERPRLRSVPLQPPDLRSYVPYGPLKESLRSPKNALVNLGSETARERACALNEPRAQQLYPSLSRERSQRANGSRLTEPPTTITTPLDTLLKPHRRRRPKAATLEIQRSRPPTEVPIATPHTEHNAPKRAAIDGFHPRPLNVPMTQRVPARACKRRSAVKAIAKPRSAQVQRPCMKPKLRSRPVPLSHPLLYSKGVPTSKSASRTESQIVANEECVQRSSPKTVRVGHPKVTGGREVVKEEVECIDVDAL